MSEVAVRDWILRTENNHSNYCPCKCHASDCCSIVVFFELGAINAGKDCSKVEISQSGWEVPTHVCWLHDRSEWYGRVITRMLTSRDDTVCVTFALFLKCTDHLCWKKLTIGEQRSSTAGGYIRVGLDHSSEITHAKISETWRRRSFNDKDISLDWGGNESGDSHWQTNYLSTTFMTPERDNVFFKWKSRYSWEFGVLGWVTLSSDALGIKYILSRLDRMILCMTNCAAGKRSMALLSHSTSNAVPV